MSQESGNKWVMPEPIFRHSTGELVKPSKPVALDIEPDTLAPDPPDENVNVVDPDADTLVPNASDEAQLAVDQEADTLTPDPPEEAGPAVTESADEIAPNNSQDKSSDDPLAKLYAPPEDTPVEPAPEPTPAPPTPVEVEPQPDVSEQLSAEKIVVGSQPSQTKGSTRPIMLILGLLVLLCIAAGIAVLVYYLLYMNRPDTGGF
jgi:hypothetical protein